MMVGILFIFIIMLMIFALNFRTQTDETKQLAAEAEQLTAEQKEQLLRADELAQQIADLRNQISQEIGELNKADQARNLLLEAIEERLDQVGLSVTIDKNTGVLRLTEEAIRFAPEESGLDSRAQQNVFAVARVLRDILPAYAACPDGRACPGSSGYVVETVFIEGHTDKTGSDNLNWKLSTERAVNTYRRMVDDFPELRGLLNSQGKEILSVSGYAYTRPVIEQDDAEGYRKNRRIDLRFVMEADRRERLTQVLSLLDDMQRKVEQLRASPEQPDRRSGDPRDGAP
ncbi:OmpA family protein [Stappia indica]|uniref:OmpA family protein n=1 Tax=Stappia indica TaxID=538381 RepID=UPI0014961F94|nr:OmpA family protein [Stappia indica]